MSMRIATFASTNSLLASALRVQSRQAEITQQEASGLKSTDYGGLGSISGKVISLESSITRSQAFSTAASNANESVQQMYSDVGSMIDILSGFKANVISLDESMTNDDTSTLADNASAKLSDLVSLLNSQYSGRYLFSGSAVDTAPVDVSDLTTPTVPSTADTSYYLGDDTIASVRVSTDSTVSYGVTANNSAFETAIRALSLAASGNRDTDTIAEITSLLDDALTGLATVQTKLSLNSKTLEQSVSDQSDYQSFASTTLTGLTDIDVAKASVDMSTYQSQLEAAYSAIGKVQSLSLSKYLS